MKIIGKKGLSGLVEWMVSLIFIGGICIWLSLPWLLPWVIELIKPQYAYDNSFFGFMIVFLYITGILALHIVYKVKSFFHSININNPFIYENVKALKTMGYASFIISLCYLIKIIYYPTILTIIVTMIFIIAACFCIVLAEVFRQAVDTKNENDLTI